jgi:DedD protein
MWSGRRSCGLGYTELQMENRLKERLTGAAILVALIVLLVPEMFRGQPGDRAASGGSSAEGAPVRSYTIDLSNGPARTAPLQSTPDTSGAHAAGDSAAEPALAHPTPLDPPTVHAGSTASTPSNPPPASAPLAAPAKRATPAAPERTSAGAWSVQLGLFAQRDNAERMAHAAQNKGFAVAVSSADPKGRFHVRASGLADRASAQALQQRLREQGFTAAIVAP